MPNRKARKKILFLGHGGTIGMTFKVVDGHAVLAAPQNDNEFRAACRPILESLDNVADIVYEFITSKDSINVNFTDWKRLAERCDKAQTEGYDGIAITHGTDTLAYTATALALALAGKDPQHRSKRIPIVLTGAQSSIAELGGDARFNLENLFRTVIAAIDCNSSDVLINFLNRVFLGCRTIKLSDNRFDAMDSPNYSPVGFIDAKGVHLDPNLVGEQHKESYLKHQIAANWGDGVLVLKVSPGLEPSIVQSILESKQVKALILGSIGDGIICSSGEYSMVPVIQRAINELKIPVFIGSQFSATNATGHQYEVGSTAINAGAISCLDHTPVAIDVKVRWLIGNELCTSIADFRRAMRTSFAGEVTEPNN